MSYCGRTPGRSRATLCDVAKRVASNTWQGDLIGGRDSCSPASRGREGGAVGLAGSSRDLRGLSEDCERMPEFPVGGNDEGQ